MTSDFYVVIPTPVLALGPYPTVVYGVLRDYADMRSNECWPSHRSIAERAGISTAAVKTALSVLREEGWVSWQPRVSESGAQSSNVYTIHGSPSVQKPTPSVQKPTPPGAQKTTPSVQKSTELIPNELRPSRTNIIVPADDALFDHFWRLYPRKVGKRAAKQAFTRAAKTYDPALIVEAAAEFANDPNLPSKEFIPHPATWLNQGRWHDEPYPERGSKAASGARMFASLAQEVNG